MPVVISKDIYGSTYSLGYDSAQPERVLRRHYVEGATSLANAVDETNTGVADFATQFPLISTMPLQNITAKQVGVNRYITEQHYAWSNTNWGGGANLNTLAEYRLAYESIPVYTVGPAEASTGLPSTTAALFDAAGANRIGFRPASYPFARPVIRVSVPVQTATNPMVVWATYTGRLNSGGYTIGGLAFSGKQLRFDGAEIRARSTTALTYQGSLMFSGARSWQMHHLTESSGSWTVTAVDQYDTGTFPTL
jgi:hypothetical protein